MRPERVNKWPTPWKIFDDDDDNDDYDDDVAGCIRGFACDNENNWSLGNVSFFFVEWNSKLDDGSRPKIHQA